MSYEFGKDGGHDRGLERKGVLTMMIMMHQLTWWKE